MHKIYSASVLMMLLSMALMRAGNDKALSTFVRDNVLSQKFPQVESLQEFQPSLWDEGMHALGAYAITSAKLYGCALMSTNAHYVPGFGMVLGTALAEGFYCKYLYERRSKIINLTGLSILSGLAILTYAANQSSNEFWALCNQGSSLCVDYFS